MPHLSIVVPCPVDNEQFENTLISVLENRPSCCEVIVVQPRAYSDPYALSDEVRFVTAAHSQTIVDLVRTGMAAARGEIVHLLGCGVCATDGWAEAGRAAFDDERVASVSPVIVEPGDTSRIIAMGVSHGLGGVRRITTRGARVMGPTLEGGFFRRSCLESIGGFRSLAGDASCDVDVALSLHEHGWRNRVCRDCLLLADRQTLRSGPGAFADGLGDERVFWRHVRSHWMSVLFHPVTAATEMITETGHRRWVKPLGRLAGLCCAPWDVVRAHYSSRPGFSRGPEASVQDGDRRRAA